MSLLNIPGFAAGLAAIDGTDLDGPDVTPFIAVAAALAHARESRADFVTDPLTNRAAIDGLLERASKVKGLHNLTVSLKAAIKQHDASAATVAKLGTNPDYAVAMANAEVKRSNLADKVAQLVAELEEAITAKATPVSQQSDLHPHSAAITARAEALINQIATSPIDVSPSDMVRTMAPDIYESYIRSRGVWYKKGTAGSVETADEDELIESFNKHFADTMAGTVIERAIGLCGSEEVNAVAKAVLMKWSRHTFTYNKLHEYLQTDESMKVCDWLFPMIVDGKPMVLDRKNGRLTEEPPEGCLVLYPAVTATATGESRALDAMVAHHFKTPEEVKTFYRTCGLSLYGYGIPNLVFLLGSGGSGKDALFSLMRAVHGEKLTVMLNAQALMGHDESNDLVRLQNARIALCAFESSHVFDGAFQPNTLKSITSGGMNPLTARAKYARAAVDIYFRGSLWLYGNHVPNLTGGGDFDGLDRRFMVMPMRRKLPRVAPPAGFDAWPDAIVACAPVFANRCLKAFMEWHAEGTPGFADVRERIPSSWAEFSASKLTSGSRFGFLTDIFQPDSYGLKVETVLDVMSVLMKSERSKLPRSKFLQVLADTMRPGARFEDHKHMEPGDPRDEGHERLPITVVESRLNRWLDQDMRALALTPLAADGGWDRAGAEAGYLFMQSELARTLAKYEAEVDE